MKQERHNLLFCRMNCSRTLPKSNSITFSLTVTSDHYSVSISQECTSVTISKINLLGPSPGKFQHGTKTFRIRSTYRARSQEISRASIAACHSVMSQLLLHIPIHVLEVRSAYSGWLLHSISLKADRQVNIECVITLILEIWQWRWILHRVW